MHVLGQLCSERSLPTGFLTHAIVNVPSTAARRKSCKEPTSRSPFHDYVKLSASHVKLALLENYSPDVSSGVDISSVSSASPLHCACCLPYIAHTLSNRLNLFPL